MHVYDDLLVSPLRPSWVAEDNRPIVVTYFPTDDDQEGARSWILQVTSCCAHCSMELIKEPPELWRLVQAPLLPPRGIGRETFCGDGTLPPTQKNSRCSQLNPVRKSTSRRSSACWTSSPRPSVKPASKCMGDYVAHDKNITIHGDYIGRDKRLF